MFILNGSNYTDGKATMRSADGSVVHGGTLKIYAGGSQVSSSSIGTDGKASFDVEPGTLYVFEIYDSNGVLVSVLDPVLYELLDGGDGGGGQGGDDSLSERVDALEAGLAEEKILRSDADYAASMRIDANAEKITENTRRIVVEAAQRTYADAGLQNSITEEASTRASADEDLAQQIEDSRIDVDESLDTESTNPVENRAVTAAVNGKQDQLTEMTDQEVNDLINSL